MRTSPPLALLLPAAALLLAGSCNCGAGRLVFAGGGTLRVTVLRADARSVALQVVLEHSGEPPLDTEVAMPSVPMETDVPGLAPGTYTARLLTRDAAGLALQSVLVTDLEIVAKQVTEIVVDLGTAPPAALEACNGEDDDGDGDVDESVDLPVCTACAGGSAQPLDDDDRCGAIDCSGLDTFALRGDNSAAAASACVHLTHPSLTSARCTAAGACAAPNGPACGPGTETPIAQAGLCQVLTGCEAGTPAVETSPDDTPCAAGRVCRSGACVVPGGAPPSGCADGTREGFVSQATYPDIAGCSGAWTVPGVTRANLQPACGRAAGNSGALPDGAGCAAVDLCAAGWHVCAGKDEVAVKAHGSCADAVPPGAPDKSLFFAVGQASQSNTTCDVGGDNDVFGCGNLGTALTPVRGCGVLNRALASTQAGTCGFNEAEPSLGPWQCLGAADSHLHEGALVTKHGCPPGSCSYDGSPVANWDKGGVLCCRD